MRKILLLLWRMWFYLLSSTLVIILFPLLALLLLFPDGYRPFFWIARNLWARTVLLGTGFWMKKTFKTTVDLKKNYMLVANHSSYIDIMLMFAAAPNPFVFVGKKRIG